MAATVMCVVLVVAMAAMMSLPPSDPASKQLDNHLDWSESANDEFDQFLELQDRYAQFKGEMFGQHNEFHGGRSRGDGPKEYQILPHRWPNRTMPYIIDGFFSPTQRQRIQSVIDDFHARTCVKLQPYRDGDRDFVWIKGDATSSSSHVGRKGGIQTVGLKHCCEKKGSIIHELLHAWGFHHQHSATDRDAYVRINWENIKPEFRNNFRKHKGANFDHPYDYESVMHYDAYAFSKNGLPTIEPLQPNVTFGQREDFSDSDILKLKRLYDCPV